MTQVIEHKRLRQPSVYPHTTSEVSVRETHISWLYLTDHEVYKVKKPLDLGFLNFSTLEQRQFYCEQELALNRRLSSDVYREVEPLYEGSDGVNFEGEGPVVDYALYMRRLSEADNLQARLQAGEAAKELPETWPDQLAERLVAFHRAHPLPPSDEVYGDLEHIRADWEENFTQTIDAIAQTLSPNTYQRIQLSVSEFMYRRADWFAQRVNEGRIRDCHGDLRAEHIYLEDKAFQIIDCIEFNHRFRYIDTASEVAFLAMDLERLGAPNGARQFVRAYVRRSGDVNLYRLLDFYRCYRAYVRGKVTSMQMETAAPEDRDAVRHQAESYFLCALQYAVNLVQPLLLLTTGLIGSGKTTVANGMADALDLEAFSSDHVRKRREQAPSQEASGNGYGEGRYSDEAKRQTYQDVAELARHSLVQGQSVILDASFARRAERERILALARDVGARACLLECVAPEMAIRDRLRAREPSEESLSEAREDILSDFQRDYEPVRQSEWTCHVRLDTSQEVEMCVQEALAALLWVYRGDGDFS